MDLESGSAGSAVASKLAAFCLQRCISEHRKCVAIRKLVGYTPTQLLDIEFEKVTYGNSACTCPATQ